MTNKDFEERTDIIVSAILKVVLTIAMLSLVIGAAVLAVFRLGGVI